MMSHVVSFISQIYRIYSTDASFSSDKSTVSYSQPVHLLIAVRRHCFPLELLYVFLLRQRGRVFLAETRARSYSVKIDRDKLARSRVRQFPEIETDYVQCKPMKKLRAFVLREKCAKKQSDGNRNTGLLIDNVAYAKTKRNRISGKSNFPDNQIESKNS